jgi:signal transduction histidine kinase/ligand-binding sensor domain-containing protein
MRLSLSLALLLAFASRAWSLDPALHLSQYGHTAWRIQDAAFAGAPISIAQTSDGYLWLGTRAGLVRFDGVTFTPFVPPEGEVPFNPQIQALLGSSDGSLWIGTASYLYRLKDGALTLIKDSGSEIQTIREDADGTIWVARARINDRPLCKVVDASLQCYGKEDGIPMSNLNVLAIDGQGTLWAASPSQLTQWRQGGLSQTFTLPAAKADENLVGISAIAPWQNGSLMVGVALAQGLGLQTFTHGTWKPYASKGFDAGSLPVSSLLRGHQSELWVGTDKGLYRIVGDSTDHFGVTDGLSGNAVLGLFEDHEGNLWVITSSGLDRFRDVRVASISQREGLSADMVSALLAARDGTIWMSNGATLEALQRDVVSRINNGHIPGKQLTSLLEDDRGRLWVGIDNQLAVLANGKFTPIRRADGSPTGSVISITEDSERNIWAYVIQPPRALLHIKDDRVMEAIPETRVPYSFSMAPDPRGGIWLGLEGSRLARYFHDHLEEIKFDQIRGNASVVDVAVGSDGSVFGASTQGVLAWRNGVKRVLTADNGLPCNRIHSLVLDKAANLWLYTQCGLLEVSEGDLRAMWLRTNTVVKPRILDALDGVHSGYAVFQPSSALSPDGRLWFANDDDVQVLDPSRLRKNTLPPPVHIEQVIADRKRHPYAPSLDLPAHTRDVEIDYTALSLTFPEKVAFRYKLEGHDSGWQEPGARRQAFYDDLPPGKYQFHVIAANSDGVWNEAGATLRLRIAAAWYQTLQFKLACVALVGILVWTGYRIRVKQLATAITVRFDERMAERTRLAQDLHDTMLQTILASKRLADDELEEDSDAEGLRRTMRRISQWLAQATQEGRAALNSLRVSLTLRNDLAEAFQRTAEDCAHRQPMEVSTDVVGESRELHPIARDEIFRIGYEAIRNACLHSGGTRLSIQLIYAQDLTLSVRDDGAGMDAEVAELGKEGHFGLRGMKERAMRIGGHLAISSTAGAGTEIRLRVPGKLIFASKPRTAVSLLAKVRGWLSSRPLPPS